jgi:HK97 family phage prohead protease
MSEPEVLRREVSLRVAEEGDGRTLEALLVPYNQTATVSDGGDPYEERFIPGAFKAQMGAAHRIKAFLNFRHRQSMADVIGHATSIEDHDDGLHGTLRVLEVSDGDKALALIRAGVLDRLSIEFVPKKSRVVGGVVERVAARLIGVALVPEGAYDTAQNPPTRTRRPSRRSRSGRGPRISTRILPSPSASTPTCPTDSCPCQTNPSTMRT